MGSTMFNKEHVAKPTLCCVKKITRYRYNNTISYQYVMWYGKYCDNLDNMLYIYSQGKVAATHFIKYLLNSYSVQENNRTNKI